MPVIDMLLSQTPYSGSGTQRKHEFILTQTGMNDDDVLDWLLTPNATFTGRIQRPGSDALISSPLTGEETPIYQFYSGRPLTDLSYELVRDCDPEYYRITATYESGQGGDGQVEPERGKSNATLSYELAPENELIRQSLETIAQYPPLNSTEPFAPLMHNAINVQKDGTVEGVQAPTSPSQVTFGFTQAASWWTGVKRLQISHAVGKVNSADLTMGNVTYAPGEVRFLGASGQIGSGDSTVELSFGIIENQINIEIAGIDSKNAVPLGQVPTGIIKEGWDYLWVLYGDGESAGKRTAKPRGAYVERIFRRTDLNALFS